jgi:hypothetical protein
MSDLKAMDTIFTHYYTTQVQHIDIESNKILNAFPVAYQAIQKINNLIQMKEPEVKKDYSSFNSMNIPQKAEISLAAQKDTIFQTESKHLISWAENLALFKRFIIGGDFVLNILAEIKATIEARSYICSRGPTVDSEKLEKNLEGFDKLIVYLVGEKKKSLVKEFIDYYKPPSPTVIVNKEKTRCFTFPFTCCYSQTDRQTDRMNE